jgi:transposase
MGETLTPLGIDISKAHFHVALVKGDKRVNYRQFANDGEGFAQLSQWLQQQGIEQVHGCLEATSIYGHALAIHPHQDGHQASIVNPMRIKGYAKSQLSRTKSDRADAKLIAYFCRDLKPAPWQPAEAEVMKLQAYTRRLDALEQMLTQEKNRLKITLQELSADIEDHIRYLKEQVKTVKKHCLNHIQTSEPLREQHDLLTSIVGVGDSTAARVLAEIGSIQHFDSARQLAAFAGLPPQEHDIGHLGERQNAVVQDWQSSFAQSHVLSGFEPD